MKFSRRSSRSGFEFSRTVLQTGSPTKYALWMSIGCNSRYNQGSDRSFKYGKGFRSGWSRLDLTVSLLVLWEQTVGEMSRFGFSYHRFLILCRFLPEKICNKWYHTLQKKLYYVTDLWCDSKLMMIHCIINIGKYKNNNFVYDLYSVKRNLNNESCVSNNLYL